jgi:hypothetical protein
MHADHPAAEGKPGAEPPAQGLVFMTTRAYLRRFSLRGPLRLVTRALSRGDYRDAWRILRMRG